MRENDNISIRFSNGEIGKVKVMEKEFIEWAEESGWGMMSPYEYVKLDAKGRVSVKEHGAIYSEYLKQKE